MKITFKEFYLKENEYENIKIPDYRFQYLDMYDLDYFIKKYLKPIPINIFKCEYDEIIDIDELKYSRGSVGEKRKFHIVKRNNGEGYTAFGNYTMKEWWEFLVDISEHGLKEPILISKDKREIIEGNYRLEAMKQLGYTKIPVEYARR